MRSAPPSVPNIQSQHWYLHLSRDTHENTRASTHSSSVPRKMSNPPPDQQIAPRGRRNQHLGQLCAGETGTSLLPPRGQATADDGRNRSTAGGYDVFAAGQARAYGPAGPLWHEEHALRRRACANVQQSVHSTGVRDVTSHVPFQLCSCLRLLILKKCPACLHVRQD